MSGRPNLSGALIDQILTDYLEHSMTMQQIADRHGVSCNTIKRHAKARGLPTRRKGVLPFEKSTPTVAAATRLERQSWTDDAACQTAQPELFQSVSREDPKIRRVRVRAAKQICGDCPVITFCLEFALNTRERHGIWGGLTPEERHRLNQGKAVPGA